MSVDLEDLERLAREVVEARVAARREYATARSETKAAIAYLEADVRFSNAARPSVVVALLEERKRLRAAVRSLLDCPDIADNDHKDEETHAAERFARAALEGEKP